MKPSEDATRKDVVYRGMTREEVEAQYFLRGLRPDYETTMLPRWLERSEALVARADGELDLRYGPTERSRLDLFRCGSAGAPFVLYVHGGYWQRGDKSVYRFVAGPLLDRGVDVALASYDMCPSVRLSRIAPQIQGAVVWLWRHAAELGISRDRFNVMGHSAGGHLSVEMLCTEWPALGDDLPRSLLAAGIALSGIYDFAPIVHCSENEGLGLDESEAQAVSPIHRALATDAPVLLAYGANEPPDMHRQSQALYERFRPMSRHMRCYEVPGADHFDVVDVLADPESVLFEHVVALLAR